MRDKRPTSRPPKAASGKSAVKIIAPVLAILLAFIGLAGATEGTAIRELFSNLDIPFGSDDDSVPPTASGRRSVMDDRVKTAKVKPSSESISLEVEPALFKELFSVPGPEQEAGGGAGAHSWTPGVDPSGYAGSGLGSRMPGTRFFLPAAFSQGGFSSGSGGSGGGSAGGSGGGSTGTSSAPRSTATQPFDAQEIAQVLPMARILGDPGSSGDGGSPYSYSPSGPSKNLLDSPRDLLDPSDPATDPTGPDAANGPVPTPEPASMFLSGLGLAGIWAARRRAARKG